MKLSSAMQDGIEKFCRVEIRWGKEFVSINSLIKAYDKTMNASYEVAREFKIPLWFRILKKKSEKYKFKSLKTFVLKRCIAEDYTLPLPKFLYDKVYSRYKRLSNKKLQLFYMTLLANHEAGASPIVAMTKIRTARYTTPFMRKIFKLWELNSVTGDKMFAQSVKDYGGMFGNFETQIYSEVVDTGKDDMVLKSLVEYLTDLVAIDEKLKWIIVIGLGGLLFVYSAFAGLIYILVPKVLTSFQITSPTGILQTLYTWSNFFNTPIGVISLILSVPVIARIFYYLKKSSVVNWLLLQIPYIRDTVIYMEMYKFSTTLHIHTEYLANKGYPDLLEDAIEVISNPIIKKFFEYKVSVVRETNEFNDFFEKNIFIGEYFDIINAQDTMVGKVEVFKNKIMANKEVAFAKIPAAVNAGITTVSIFAMLGVIYVLMQLDNYISNPENFIQF